MKILVVDDDSTLRHILQIQLTRAGYEVAQAEDGQVAWDVMQRETIRFVITDWMMPEMDGPELIRRIRQANLSGYTYIIMLTAKEGKEAVVTGLEAGADDYLTKPFDPGEFRARVAIGKRILSLETRLNESLVRLEELAMRDGLTGLFNRWALYEYTEAELIRARREHFPLSLVLIDIDHFKAVNDQYGHLFGDQALKLVSEIIIHSKRPYDWAGRWGGEEFLVVLPNTATQDAKLVAERMRENVAAAKLPLADNNHLQLYISLGVTSILTSPGTGPISPILDRLLHQADEALYRAKRSGRNRVCLFGDEQLAAAP